MGNKPILLLDEPLSNLDAKLRVEVRTELRQLQQKLGIEGGGCTPDGRFSLDACRCLGCCGMAPVIMVNSDVYGSLTGDELDAILDKYQ